MVLSSILVFLSSSSTHSRSVTLLLLLCFWFSLLLLTYFSLHAQEKWHVGWLGSVFCLEEGCMCCSNGCANSGRRSRLMIPPCFRSLFLLSNSLLTQSTLGGLHAASQFQFSLWERGLLPAELHLDLRERKGHLLSLPCINTPS